MPSKGSCYQLAANYVLKNPDYVLVHGIVTSVALAEVRHAWVKKGDKIYHVGQDKWYDASEWEKWAVEEYVYDYEEVMRLIEFTAHPGPWNQDERKRASNG